MSIANQLQETALKKGEIRSRYLFNKHKMNQFGLPEYGKDKVSDLIDNVIAGTGSQDLLKSGFGVETATGEQYTIADIHQQAITLAMEEFTKSWDAGDIRPGTENIIFPQIVDKYVLEIVGPAPKARAIRAKGGQVIKKKKGSIINESVQEKTTGEVLRELKG